MFNWSLGEIIEPSKDSFSNEIGVSGAMVRGGCSSYFINTSVNLTLVGLGGCQL